MRAGSTALPHRTQPSPSGTIGSGTTAPAIVRGVTPVASLQRADVVLYYTTFSESFFSDMISPSFLCLKEEGSSAMLARARASNASMPGRVNHLIVMTELTVLVSAIALLVHEVEAVPSEAPHRSNMENDRCGEALGPNTHVSRDDLRVQRHERVSSALHRWRPVPTPELFRTTIFYAERTPAATHPLEQNKPQMQMACSC